MNEGMEKVGWKDEYRDEWKNEEKTNEGIDDRSIKYIGYIYKNKNSCSMISILKA